MYRVLSLCILVYRAPRQLPGSPAAAATTISSETSFRVLVSNTGSFNIILALVLFQHSHDDSYVMYDASGFGSRTENVDKYCIGLRIINYIMHSDRIRMCCGYGSRIENDEIL